MAEGRLSGLETVLFLFLSFALLPLVSPVSHDGIDCQLSETCATLVQVECTDG